MKIFQEETAVMETPAGRGLSHSRGRSVNMTSASQSKRSGRTPLKPHNHQMSPLSPMQAFRRSLKDATNSRDDSRTSNHGPDTKKPSFSSKLVKPKSNIATRTTRSLPKKQGLSTVVTVKSQNTVPSSKLSSGSSTTAVSTTTSSLRRSLRTTLSPPPSGASKMISPKRNGASEMLLTASQSALRDSDNATAVGKHRGKHQVAFKPSTGIVIGQGRRQNLLGGKKFTMNPSNSRHSIMGPPQRMLPRTPNSLLRTELNTSDEEDESMLVSPPGAPWNFLTTSTTSLVVVSPAAAAFLSPQASSQSTKHKQRKDQSTSPPVSSPPLQPRTILTSPEPSKRPFSDQQQPLKMQDLKSSSGHDFLMSPATKNQSKQQNPNLPLQGESLREQSTHGEGLLERYSSPPTQIQALESSKEDITTAVDPTNDGASVKSAAQSQKIASKNPVSIYTNQDSSSRRKVGSRIPEDRGKVNGITQAGYESIPTANSSRYKANLSGAKGIHQLASKEPIRRENGVYMDLSNVFRDDKTRKDKLSQKNTVVGEAENVSNHRGNNGVALDLSSLFTDTTRVINKKQPPLLSHRSNDRESNLKRNSASSVDKRIKSGSSKVTGPLQVLKPSTAATSQPPASAAATKAVVSGVVAVERRGTSSSSSKKVKAAIPRSLGNLKPVDTWAEKQSETFVCWLNYTFKPTEDVDHEESPGGQPLSPSRPAGLRTLLLHRRMAQSRMKASVLFRSQNMSKIRQSVFNEIVKGGLSLRSDRDLYADLGLRKQIISLLLSYTTPWLQLGLEVIFGEIILPEHTDSQLASPTKASMSNQGNRKSASLMRGALQAFISNRVLSDATVLAKYTKGKCKVPSGKFEKQYRAEMRDLVLYRLMVLIFYLDRAKKENILDKEPRLFTKGSSVKSSNEVLLALCRDFLSSEGNFIKHLSRIGLTVSYKQDRLDELEFSVTNLAVDLRDGVRLTRMVEILTDAVPKSLMTTLRLPAVSRLQKLHNVGVAMSSLRDFGVELADDVHTHHIVDGHREMVLKLMWSVIVYCCFHKLLTKDQVEEEIRNVLRSNQARRRVQGNSDEVKTDAELPEAEMIESLSPDQLLKSQLFRWCQAVCSCFDLHLSDLTTSFADGKAFCYLVHYYHPSLIGFEEILPTTHDESRGLSDEVLLANERKNSTMACRRVCELGGIPKMIPSSDVTNPPNEECTLLCLAYLCSRLTESSKEILATILIQARYRKYKKREAARKIWKAWILNKDSYYRAQSRRYAAAVSIVEEFILTHKDSLARLKRKRLNEERRVCSVIHIQRVYRGKLGRLQSIILREEQQASSVIHNSWRCFQARQKYSALIASRDAATIVQRVWRGYSWRMQFEFMGLAAMQLQRITRGGLSRKQMHRERCAAAVIQRAWWNLIAFWEREESAVLIQCHWRRLSARTESAVRMLHRDAAIELQRLWRGCYHRLIFEISIQSVILIQKVSRGHLARKELPLRRCRVAATIIQKRWRCFSAQVLYQLDLLDIICVQSYMRRRIAINQYRGRMRAIGTLQRAFRSSLSRQVLRMRWEQQENKKQRNFAAVTVQSAVRSLLSKKELLLRRRESRCAIRIQSLWRRVVEIKAYTRIVESTTTIQALYRGVSVRSILQQHSNAASLIQHTWRHHQWNTTQHSSATDIQRIWRGFWSSMGFKFSIQAAIRVQSMCRRRIAMNDLRRSYLAATVLQNEWRRYWAQYNYNLDVLEIIIVQSIVRRRRANVVASRRRSAILALQQVVRHYQAKCKYARRRASGILLQAAYRKRLAMKVATTRRRAILIIQSAVRQQRAIVMMSHCKSAIVSLQCYIRKKQAKGIASLRQNACLLIQTFMRRSLAKENASTRRLAIIAIQTITRKRYASEKASQRKRALLVLQCSLRRELARCIASRRRVAGLLLQSFARKRLAINTASTTRIAILTIQRMIRKKIGFKKAEARKHAILVIQSAMRRSLAALHLELLKDIKFRREVLVKAVIFCQSLMRGYIARSSSRRRMRAISCIQTRWRVRSSMRRYQRIRAASTVLQAAFRGSRSRREHSRRRVAATKIQQSWRSFSAFVRFQLIINDVITIQSIVRRLCARRLSRERRDAVCSLQQACRRLIAFQRLCRLRVKHDKQKKEEGTAVFLQALGRGFLVRRVFSVFHRSATSVQKVFRGYRARMEYSMDSVDIVIVQSLSRRWLAFRSAKRRDLAATVVQSTVRGFLSSHRFGTMLAAKKSFDLTVVSCIRIQCLWRGVVARNFAKRHAAARAIQKTWRCFDVHVDYMIKVLEVVAIQSSIRRFMARTSFQKARRGIVLLQSLVRRRVQSNKLSKMTHAAVIVQSGVRLALSTLEFRRYRQASITIQRYTRGFLVRDEHAIANFAATDIQRIWRGYSKFVDYALVLISVSKIQSVMRVLLAKHAFRNLQLTEWAEKAFLDKKAVCLQRSFREYSRRLRDLRATLSIQQVARAFLVKIRARRFMDGITRLQAVYRARFLRCRLPLKIVNVAKRVCRANARARDDPKMRLGCRTSSALTVLQTSSRLSELMAAVATLETSTRLSFVCCVNFTNSEATEILLSLIRTCNRSLPHMELLQYILLTFDNIARHPSLLPSFANPEAAEVFMDLSQVFRDKDGIFCLSVSLLGCVFRCDNDVKSLCSSRENLKRLKGVHALCSRKVRSGSSKNPAIPNRTRRRDVFDVRLGLQTLQDIIFTLENGDPLLMNGSQRKFKF